MIQAKIDLSQFSTVIQTSTKYMSISMEVQGRESVFMFHAKIVDQEFKEPLRPMISYKIIENK